MPARASLTVLCALALCAIAPPAMAATEGSTVTRSSPFVGTTMVTIDGGTSASVVAVTRASTTVTVIDSAGAEPGNPSCLQGANANTVTCTMPADHSLSIDATLGAGDDSIDLTGAAYTSSTLVGEAGGDTLTGGAGRDRLFPEFNGTASNDTTAPDVLQGNGGIDTVSYAFVERTTGISVDLDGVADDGGGGVDNVGADVENITGTAQRDTLTGNDEDNVIDGGSCCDNGSGTETLSGGGGQDNLSASSGNQVMDGGEGNDTMSASGNIGFGGSTDDDVITGGNGVDTVSYTGRDASQPVRIDLTAGSSNNGIKQGTSGEPDENDTFTDAIENANSGQGADQILGNALPNTLNTRENHTEMADEVSTCGGAADTVNADALDVIDRTSCETVAFLNTGGVLSIGNASVQEGNTGQRLLTFTVTRTGGTGATSFRYGTSGGTASAGADYVGASARPGLINTNGTGTTKVSVPILGDTTDEPDESFNVLLSNVANGTLVDGTGIGTIVDDDATAGGVVADAIAPAIPAGSTNDPVTVKKGAAVVKVGPFGEAVTGSVSVKSGAAVASAKKKRISLGKKSFKAAAGKVVKVRFKLSRKNAKLVRRLKKVRMTASIAVKDAAGNPKTAKVKFTLKAPKAKKKRKRG